jgi:mannose-6-phosphate isomerase-like protein (cupin superfamily)
LESQATGFKYERPELTTTPKAFVKFFRSDIMSAEVQVIKEGGENNLHSHKYSDGFWMVLAGRATFYGTDDKVIAELGPMEGVHIPREFPYWFESSSAEPLELLHVAASLPAKSGSDRMDHEAQKARQHEKVYVDASRAPER